MRQIWVFQHAPGEGAGYLGAMMGRDRVPHRVLRAAEGDPVPGTLEGAAGVVLLGGPMGANDPLPWIWAEMGIVRAAVDRGLPVLGICLGAQIVAKAFGGEVAASPVPEIGWLPVSRADNESGERWFGGLPGEFEAFQWHADTFTLPKGAVPLLSSVDCANQGFEFGSALAFQCHLEMTEEMVREWAIAAPPELRSGSRTVQTPDQMGEKLHERVEALNWIAEQVFSRWLANVQQHI